MEWLIGAGIIALIAYVAGSKSGNKPKTSVPTYKSAQTNTQKPVTKPRLNVKHADISNIKLSDEQEKIFNLLETTDDHYYITGKAGTGKSVFLQYFVENSGKRVDVTAPTGVAALNVGGQTYQSVAIDLSDGAFAYGQTYVALSRCVSLEGLYLDSPIRRDDIIVDPDIVNFMKKAIISEATA